MQGALEPTTTAWPYLGPAAQYCSWTDPPAGAVRFLTLKLPRFGVPASIGMTVPAPPVRGLTMTKGREVKGFVKALYRGVRLTPKMLPYS